MQINADNSRAGVTLTEVLMSIMIMSIGIVSVAALFPLSIVRSIQASQLTNAALARYDADAKIDTFLGPSNIERSLVHDPDGDGNLQEHFRNAASRRYIVDPWGYFIHLQDMTDEGITDQTKTLATSRHAFFGNRNSQTASGILGGTTGDFAAWSIPRFDGGFEFFERPGNPANPALTPAEIQLLADRAAALVASRDGWDGHVDVEVEEGQLLPGGIQPLAVTLPDSDLTTLPVDSQTGNLRDTRITLFDVDGRLSHTFPATRVDGQTVFWTEDINNNGTLDPSEDQNLNGALDTRSVPGSIPRDRIARVVIETSKARLYSWMLTVRKGPSGPATIDVVVMFNRAVDPENEQIYPATFDKTTNRVFVKNADGFEPFIKKGGFVFDLTNAYWYRIQGYDEKARSLTWAFGEYDYVIRTADPIVLSTGEDVTLPNGITGAPDGPDVDADMDGILDDDEDQNGNGIFDPAEDANGNGVVDYGGAIFLPGVVEVFPLGTKTLRGNLQ